MEQEKLLEKIRYLRDVQKMSFRQIEEETGIRRKKVSRIYYNRYTEKKAPEVILDPYRGLIENWFNKYPTLKALQVYQRLKEREVQVSYSTVIKYTRLFRKKKKPPLYWPLEFLPGEEAQVDWFFESHPNLGKLCGFIIILSYSRYLFVYLFRKATFEFFIEGHLMAFEAFAGYPHAIRYDNLKSVVLKRIPLIYNPSFLSFSRHYNFEIRLCNVSKANEKGRVERAIRHLRETFFNIQKSETSLEILNKKLYQWVEAKNNTVHRTTKKKPVELKAKEKLKSLPLHPWNNVVLYPPKRPTKTGFLIFESNLYSIPDYLRQQMLSLRVGVRSVEVYTLKNKKVATHPRSFNKNQTILNPLHRSMKQMSNPARRERIYHVIKNLDPVVEQFLYQNQKTGEDPFVTSYHFFKLIKHHNRETLFSALRELLRKRSFKLKDFLLLIDPQENLSGDSVLPQNQTLLQLDYQKRSLEDYQP